MTNTMTVPPKRLFLTDSVGALLSAVFLGVVLTRLEHFFGMPRNILYGLSFLACVFAVSSFWCYRRVDRNWRPCLKAIATVNLLYCCLTAGLVLCYRQELTTWGLVYFLLEVVVIITLATIELKTAYKWIKEKS